MNTQNKATLLSPDGRYKVVVGIGTREAAKLQTDGWQVKGGAALDKAQITSLDNALSYSTFGNINQADRNYLQEALDWIENNYQGSEAEKAILRQFAYENIGSGVNITTPGEMEDLLKIAYENAKADIDPYYNKLEREHLEDLKHQMEDIRHSSQLFKQEEALSYEQRLRQTKDNLRARGMTFSGESRRTLGDETALREGSMGVEGELPQERRYNWMRASDQMQRQARDTGVQYERLLGSEKMPQYDGLVNPYDLSDNRVGYIQNRTIPLYHGGRSDQPERFVRTGTLDEARLRDTNKRKWENVSWLSF